TAMAGMYLGTAAPPAGVRVLVLDAADAQADHAYAERGIVLPDHLTAWTDELYMGGCWLGPDFEPVLQALGDTLREPRREAAWTS
ncbi:MAG TPA: hypothetical protein VM847_20700, partial [Tahibacter sp.]|nr:hypothetical protein [Tahibacter sp.]